MRIDKKQSIWIHNILSESSIEKCMKIAETYQWNDQFRMCQEEAAELIQAINKFFRGKSKDNLKEELADTVIMITQLLCYLGIDENEWETIIQGKLDRQLIRIQQQSKRGH